MARAGLGALLTAAALAAPCGWAATYDLTEPDQALLGERQVRIARGEDTFARIAREEGVGYDALVRANPGLDPWLPGAGGEVLLPTALLLPEGPREGILVNLNELRLYYFQPGGEQVSVYPIGIGTEGRETPVMQTRTVAKLSQPTWYPSDAARARYAERGIVLARQVPPGPDNPLGALAIQLAAPGYLIHGTNQPIGVGRRVSSGCLRLYDSHIEALVAQVPNGTPVHVTRQPYKAGWHHDGLYLEVHRAGEESYTGAVRVLLRVLGVGKEMGRCRT